MTKRSDHVSNRSGQFTCQQQREGLGRRVAARHGGHLRRTDVRADDQRVVLDLRLSGDASTAAWRDVIRSLVERHVGTPRLAMIDGSAGLAAALREQWSMLAIQRCTAHKFTSRHFPPASRRAGKLKTLCAIGHAAAHSHSYNQGFARLLGRRSTVGQLPLEQVIGVRIPASQPISLTSRSLNHFATLRMISRSIDQSVGVVTLSPR
jgi:hypothetical protein